MATRAAKHFQVCTLHVGNTHTSIFAWPRHGPREWLDWRTQDEPSGKLAAFLRRNAPKGVPVVVAGVVPRRKEQFVALLGKRFPVLVFSRDLPPPIEIVPRPAAGVGEDRIAGALGALSLDDSRAWVVVDAGTAMTINAVTPGRGERLPRFEGGLIVPGAALSLRALADFTAQLPRLDAASPAHSIKESFIGRSTEQAIRLGVYHAQLAVAVELARRQMRQLGRPCRVVLTGGGSVALGSGFVRALRAQDARVVPDLCQRGLFYAWKKMQTPGP